MKDLRWGWIGELERELGQAARLRLLANAGGQRRYVPTADCAPASALARELGEDVALWLAERFGGETLTIPSRGGEDGRARARALYDAVLTAPHRSANDLAVEWGVSCRRIEQIRQDQRSGSGRAAQPSLFDAPRNASD